MLNNTAMVITLALPPTPLQGGLAIDVFMTASGPSARRAVFAPLRRLTLSTSIRKVPRFKQH